ncbi:hypothetical protein, partial [Pseudomonas viridiflava]|uniref:hypothetical protein n=2 Tax=Pseudomonas viridiflava TaxID=33069 RepID=UPI00197D4B8D
NMAPTQHLYKTLWISSILTKGIGHAGGFFSDISYEISTKASFLDVLESTNDLTTGSDHRWQMGVGMGLFKRYSFHSMRTVMPTIRHPLRTPS